MKRPEQPEPEPQARVEVRGHGVAGVTPEMIDQRAREIARIRGAAPEQVTEDDRRRAEHELRDDPLRLSTDDTRADQVTSLDPAEVGSGTGRRTAPVEAHDEQESAERAIKEGVREAEHDRMVEARRRES